MLIVSDSGATGGDNRDRQTGAERPGDKWNFFLFSLMTSNIQTVSPTTEILILEVDAGVSGNVCRR